MRPTQRHFERALIVNNSAIVHPIKNRQGKALKWISKANMLPLPQFEEKHFYQSRIWAAEEKNEIKSDFRRWRVIAQGQFSIKESRRGEAEEEKEEEEVHLSVCTVSDLRLGGHRVITLATVDMLPQFLGLLPNEEDSAEARCHSC